MGRCGDGADDFPVDLVADVGLAFEGDHVFEGGTGRDGDGGVGLVRVFVAGVFDIK